MATKLSFSLQQVWITLCRLLRVVQRSPRFRVGKLRAFFWSILARICDFVLSALPSIYLHHNPPKENGTSKALTRMGHKGKNGQSSIACASEEPTVQGTTCATTHTGRGTAPGDIPLETIVESVNAFEGLGEQAMHETSAIPFDMAHKIIMQHSSTTTGSHPSAASSLQRQSTSIQVNSLERASNAYGISHTIYPLLPEKIPRYHRNRYLSSEPEELKLSAGQQKLTLGNIPSGWEQLIHPEGQPYFYHANKRIITENWIYDPKEMRILDGFISQIENFTQSKGQNQTRDAHLVLECNQEDGVSWCGYYYVSASTRSVFWLEALDLSNINGELVLPQIDTLGKSYILSINIGITGIYSHTSMNAQIPSTIWWLMQLWTLEQVQ
ncbi:hypothetical protein H2248_003621 [Termitomyces sp. 'cryptogamus']|nr:hypothetical protein H2248_003621 [Termitomyces sp. 'cryptogamus']